MTHQHHRRPSLFWPILLIGIGVVLLLSNLGLLPPLSFNLLFRFWPLLLVIIGLDILLGRRSALGSIIKALIIVLLFGGIAGFLLLAPNAPDLLERVDSSAWQEAPISAPLLDYETASVTIDWASPPAKLYALSDSNQLIDGQISYAGSLDFDVVSQGDHAEVNLDTRRGGFVFSTGSGQHASPWEIGLHPRVSYDLNLDASSGPGDYDLHGLKISRLEIDAGSGPLTVSLPQSGIIEGVIDGGSGPIGLILPDQLEAKIVLEDGSGSFSPSHRFSRDQSERNDDASDPIWVTAGFGDTDNYIILQIDQGSGPIWIESPADQ